jgi:hypothetical protein
VAALPLLDIPDDERLSSVRANLARGNHKSARNHKHSLISMLKGEAERGWQLPLPKEAALVIPGCEVAPLGMVAQTTIDEEGGEPPRKLWLTHDQSFSPKGSSSRSVNDRVDESTLTPARFGKAFSRFLYHILYSRKIKTDEPIYMTKGDFKSAYRRIHLQAPTAVKACTCVDGILLVGLRMTFGGSPNPSLWSDVSEVVTDLANDLVRRSNLDPTRHHSPHQPLLELDRAKDDDADGALGVGEIACSHFFAPNYPIENILPRFDCYLDNIFGALYGCDKARSEAAIPMALHIVRRPNDTSGGESYPRDELLSLSKFLAEAKPAQRKIVLGWLVDTRAFVVKLPGEKQRRLSQQIDDLLRSGRRPVQARDLATLLGRLKNASYVIPYARHFNRRLYKAQKRAEAKGTITLSGPQLDNLVLWKHFLQHAAVGISINRLVCRWPTQIVRVDACPQGMGGYCLQSGIAWRFQLPESLLGRATLNALEFLAAFVEVLVEVSCGRDPEPGRQCLRGEMVSVLKFRRRLPHAPHYCAFVRGFLFEQGDRSLHQMVPGEEERRGRQSLSGFCDVRQRGHKVDSTPLLTFGSPVLQDHPFAGNNHFSHWRAAAAIAQHEALADSTHAKRNSSWRRYECFLELIGGQLDPFLRQLG